MEILNETNARSFNPKGMFVIFMLTFFENPLLIYIKR